jgi:hypothetical protein
LITLGLTQTKYFNIMRSTTGLFLLLLGIALYSCKPEEKKADQRATIVPLEDFFKDPEKAAYRISPDGEQIIFRAEHKGRMNVFIQKLGDTTATPLTHEQSVARTMPTGKATNASSL